MQRFPRTATLVVCLADLQKDLRYAARTLTKQRVFAAGRILATLLFGVRPLDAMTFASVALMMVVTAVLAIAAPAWRAIRVNPAVALRAE